jgi:hypothetical protein
MKNTVRFSSLFFVFIAFTFASCNKSNNSSNVSRATGWRLESDNYNNNFKEQELAPGMVFIEGGTFTKGKVQDDIMKDWNNAACLFIWMKLR